MKKSNTGHRWEKYEIQRESSIPWKWDQSTISWPRNDLWPTSDVKMCYVITNLKVGACVKSKYGFGIYFNAPNLLNLFKFIFCQILSEFENSDKRESRIILE